MNNLIPNFLNKISQELKVLEISRQRYAKQLAPTFSVFDYIYTDEMMLSRIISDLLNPKGKHAQGSIFLSLFFNLLNFPSDWSELNLEQATITIELEKITKNGRRMDIYINIHSEGKNYGICIENKPFAADSTNQLNDYAIEMERLNKKKWHIVYLSGYAQKPSENSIPLNKLNEWIQEKKYSQINFSSLHDWLKKCMAESQNDHVNHFLKAFQNYILNKFVGVNDMSEQESIVNITLSSAQNIQAAFEVFSAKDAIQDALVRNFQSQLTHAAKSKGWITEGDFSREHWTGVNFFYAKNHKFSFKVEFHHYNYRGFFLGIVKSDKNSNCLEISQKIYLIVSELFPHEKVKNSDWWAAYIDQKEWDWQTNINVWSMIESGELCQRIMNYAGQIHDVLTNAKLLDQFNIS